MPFFVDHPKSVKIFLPTLLYSFRKRYLNIVLKRGEKRKKMPENGATFSHIFDDDEKGGL